VRKDSNDRLQENTRHAVMNAFASVPSHAWLRDPLRIEQVSASVLRLDEGSLYPLSTE
jgi:hypothetical protein